MWREFVGSGTRLVFGAAPEPVPEPVGLMIESSVENSQEFCAQL